jgi:hypothetical protein
VEDLRNVPVVLDLLVLMMQGPLTGRHSLSSQLVHHIGSRRELRHKRRPELQRVERYFVVLRCPDHRGRCSVRSRSSNGQRTVRAAESLHECRSLLVLDGRRARRLGGGRRRPLPLSVSVQLVVLQVVLGLEILAAHIARGPLLWLLVHIVDVLAQIAFGGILPATNGTQRGAVRRAAVRGGMSTRRQRRWA